MIKKEISENNNSLLLNLLERNGLLEKIFTLVKNDMIKYDRDKDIHSINITEYDTNYPTIKDKIAIISLVEYNKKGKILKELKNQKYNYYDTLQTLNNKQNVYNSRMKLVELKKKELRKTKIDSIKIYTTILLSLLLIKGSSYLAKEESKLIREHEELHQNEKMSDEAYNSFMTLSAVLIIITAILDICFVVKSFECASKIIKELFNLVTNYNESNVGKIKSIMDELKSKLEFANISKKDYEHYLKELNDLEIKLNESIDKYIEFNYLLKQNKIERVKHIDYEL